MNIADFLKSKEIEYTADNVKDVVTEVRRMASDKKTGILNVVPNAKGINFRVLFTSSLKMYTYGEEKFLSLTNYAKVSRVLITALDESGQVLMMLPFVDFIE